MKHSHDEQTFQNLRTSVLIRLGPMWVQRLDVVHAYFCTDEVDDADLVTPVQEAFQYAIDCAVRREAYASQEAWMRTLALMERGGARLVEEVESFLVDH